jgi:phosphatidylinositol alpha 1,6-mannosyltransferase
LRTDPLLLDRHHHRELVRVALVAETFLPAVNGVVNSVVRVADHLATRGHETVVVAPSCPAGSFETPRGRHIDVVVVPAMKVPAYSGLSIARPGLDLRPVLADLAPDVVHLASPLVLGWSGAVAADSLGIPSIAVFQTDMSGFLRRYRLGMTSPALWAGLRRMHNLTDLNLVPSTSTAYQLRAHGIGPLAIWSRGVDSERFHPRHRSERLHRELAGIGNLVVGFVGRLAAEKRVGLLEPISRLSGVQLVIIGDGPKRASLERRMPHARFLGLQTGAELSRYMATLDLLVNPGADETFCQVVQEALASGVPVVAAAAGGPLDLVRHGENGWLWSGDDPTVLAAQIATLRRDRRELTAVAQRTRSSVVARTWARIGDELIGHYGSVIGNRTAGTPMLSQPEVVPIKAARMSRLRRRAS